MIIDNELMYLNLSIVKIKDGTHNRGLITASNGTYDPWSKLWTKHYWLHIGRYSYGLRKVTMNE